MFEKLKAQRAELMAAANQMIEDGDIDGANAKMDEIKALDDKINALLVAKKNADALSNAAPAVDISGESTVPVGTSAEGSIDLGLMGTDNGTENDAAERKYENAWAKWAVKPETMSVEDVAVMKAYNAAFTTTTTSAVIPSTLMKGILDDVSEAYPFYADVFKTYVKGTVTFAKDTASSDAAWYDESTSTADGSETFATITLNGCELARSITVSWKLKEMSISEFLPYIRAKLSEKMGAALGYGVLRGRGVAASTESSPWKPEPLGILTQLAKSTYSAQNIAVANPTAQQMIAAFAAANAAIDAKYEAGAAYYINSKTLWGRIASICDTVGRPIFTVSSDVANSVVGHILGKAVKLDSAVPDDKILVGNAKNGYAVNINKDVTLNTEDHVKQRNTDYAAYAIVDGAPLAEKAFALISLSYTA